MAKRSLISKPSYMGGYVGMLCVNRLQATVCDALEGADVALLEFGL
jgi:hypothetical protein